MCVCTDSAVSARILCRSAQMSTSKTWTLDLSKLSQLFSPHPNRQFSPTHSLIRNLVITGDTSGWNWRDLNLLVGSNLQFLAFKGPVAPIFVDAALCMACSVETLRIDDLNHSLHKSIRLGNVKDLTVHDCRNSSSLGFLLRSNASSLVRLEVVLASEIQPSPSAFKMLSALTSLGIRMYKLQMAAILPLKHSLVELTLNFDASDVEEGRHADLSGFSALTSLAFYGDWDKDLILPSSGLLIELLLSRVDIRILDSSAILLKNLRYLEIHENGRVDETATIFESIGRHCTALEKLRFEASAMNDEGQDSDEEQMVDLVDEWMDDSSSSSWIVHTRLTELHLWAVNVDLACMPATLTRLCIRDGNLLSFGAPVLDRLNKLTVLQLENCTLISKCVKLLKSIDSLKVKYI
jgi:hypothetical protein